jgi:hypothetical protein
MSAFTTDERRRLRDVIDSHERVIGVIEQYERTQWIFGFAGRTAKWVVSVGGAVGVLHLLLNGSFPLPK